MQKKLSNGELLLMGMIRTGKQRHSSVASHEPALGSLIKKGLVCLRNFSENDAENLYLIGTLEGKTWLREHA